MNSSAKITTIAFPTPTTTSSLPLAAVPSIRAPPITATVRPTPPISIPAAITTSKKKASPFSDDNSIWTIPPVPSSTVSGNTNTNNSNSNDGDRDSNHDPPLPMSPTTDDNSGGSPPPSPPPPPPPPAIGGGPWSPSLFRPVPSSPNSAFHTPPPVVKPVVRPPPFPSPKLPCVLPPPPLAYLTDISTPSTSTQSTTVSNVDSEAVIATGAITTVTNSKDVFPSPPIAPIAPSSVTTVSQQPQSGVSPSGISRLSSGSGGSGSVREAVLCNSCGQLHDPHAAHVYDYSETVDADLLCRICRQPLVDPIDTKCGHTFCTPCLKSHLVVQALCPEDKQIINYLECQQSSNLVKRISLDSIFHTSELLLSDWLTNPPIKSYLSTSVIFQDFESLLQETSSVLSNGGDTAGSSPVNLPPMAEAMVMLICN
ncbi:hypothetical protein Aperf_G00000096628 [Anoplocephala perfoliata]